MIGKNARVMAALFSLAAVARPVEGIDKSRFTLANPTPVSAMREMSTDRPDTTESPYTVDAGHYQLEMSFLDFTTEGAAEQFIVAPFNLKIGLTNAIDLQLVLDPYVHLESPHASGMGDFQVRAKFNLWGNDEGDTALALMPFVIFPTNTGDIGGEYVEGGLIVPFAASLPDGWGLGLMVEVDIVRDEEDEEYGIDLVHTATVSHAIAGYLAGYLEYIGVAAHDTGSGYQSYLGGGLTYGLDENTQLDCGMNIGLSDSADDFNVFAGVSFRR